MLIKKKLEGNKRYLYIYIIIIGYQIINVFLLVFAFVVILITSDLENNLINIIVYVNNDKKLFF